MATKIEHFYVSDEVKAGQVGTLHLTFAKNSPVYGLESTDFRLLGVQLSNFSTTDKGITWTGTLTPIEGFSGQASISLVANAYRNALDNSRGSAFNMTFDVDPSIILLPKAPILTLDNGETDNTNIINVTIQMPLAKVGDFLTVNGIIYTINEQMIAQGFKLQILPTTTLSATITSDHLTSHTATLPALTDVVEVTNNPNIDTQEIIELSHYSPTFDDYNPALDSIQQQLTHANSFVFGENSAIDVDYLFGNVISESLLLPISNEPTMDNSTLVGLAVINQLTDDLLGLSTLIKESDTLLTSGNAVHHHVNYDIYHTPHHPLFIQPDNIIL